MNTRMAGIMLRVLTILLGSILSTAAFATIKVFDCRFPADGLSFIVTVYDDGSPARIGREQGIGDKGQAYFDKVTGAWIVVEFTADGTLPLSLTTILKDGVAWHSRHSLTVSGEIWASQMSGKCSRKSID